MKAPQIVQQPPASSAAADLGGVLMLQWVAGDIAREQGGEVRPPAAMRWVMPNGYRKPSIEAAAALAATYRQREKHHFYYLLHICGVSNIKFVIFVSNEFVK